MDPQTLYLLQKCFNKYKKIWNHFTQHNISTNLITQNDFVGNPCTELFEHLKDLTC